MSFITTAADAVYTDVLTPLGHGIADTASWLVSPNPTLVTVYADTGITAVAAAGTQLAATALKVPGAVLGAVTGAIQWLPILIFVFLALAGWFILKNPAFLAAFI